MGGSSSKKAVYHTNKRRVNVLSLPTEKSTADVLSFKSTLETISKAQKRVEELCNKKLAIVRKMDIIDGEYKGLNMLHGSLFYKIREGLKGKEIMLDNSPLYANLPDKSTTKITQSTWKKCTGSKAVTAIYTRKDITECISRIKNSESYQVPSLQRLQLYLEKMDKAQSDARGDALKNKKYKSPKIDTIEQLHQYYCGIEDLKMVITKEIDEELLQKNEELKFPEWNPQLKVVLKASETLEKALEKLENKLRGERRRLATAPTPCLTHEPSFAVGSAASLGMIASVGLCAAFLVKRFYNRFTAKRRYSGLPLPNSLAQTV